MKTPIRLAAVLCAASALLTLSTAVTATTSQAAPPTRSISLILDYSVAGSCTVYPNYPKEGVVGNDIGWTIAPGDTVGWRYNVNDTYAMVSDKKYRSSTHPWWGFVRRDCIGTSLGGEHFPTPTSSYPVGVHIPSSILQGRSAVTESGYRPVDFSPASAHVVNDYKTVTSFGTLRDARGRFVIGNVQAGWHVHVTDQTDGPWTKVYVPNAQRWGWLENIHL